MNTRIPLRLILSGLLIVVTACTARRERADSASAVDSAASGDVMAAAMSAPVFSKRQASSVAQTVSTSTVRAAQKLIRSAEMRLEVRDVQKAMASVDSLAKLYDGLLADGRQSRDPRGRREAHLVVRIPADRFSEVVAALSRLGDVKDQSVNTQDVTREYTDLVTRRAVKEQTVLRLRALLDNRTAKLSDVLDVERELARNIAELEQMKGEQQYYDRQVAVSSIGVSLSDHVGSRMAGFVDPIVAALDHALDTLGNSIGGMLYFLVFALPWAVIGLILWWAAPRFVRSWRLRAGLASGVDATP